MLKFRKHELKIARRIQTLRTYAPQHSWSKISEIICEEYPEIVFELWGSAGTAKALIEDVRGNQSLGFDLCGWASKTLSISEEEYHNKWF